MSLPKAQPDRNFLSNKQTIPSASVPTAFPTLPVLWVFFPTVQKNSWKNPTNLQTTPSSFTSDSPCFLSQPSSPLLIPTLAGKHPCLGVASKVRLQGNARPREVQFSGPHHGSPLLLTPSASADTPGLLHKHRQALCSALHHTGAFHAHSLLHGFSDPFQSLDPLQEPEGGVWYRGFTRQSRSSQRSQGPGSRIELRNALAASTVI